MKSKKKKTKRIDVKEVFYNKNPKIAKLIPWFIYRYLKRISRQDFVNYLLERHGDKKNLEFINACLTDFNVTLEIRGEENLPEKGRSIFVSNHPLGGFDGIVLMKIIGERYKKIKFLANDILMNLTNLKEMFIPINKHGKQGMEIAREINEVFESDTQILTFPAGLVSRKINGKIADLPWQKNFITKSRASHRNVVPIHISGKNSNFFYNLSNFRKKLGIKLNIEMLYLMDETYKHRNKHLVVNIGEAIPWQQFDSSKKPQEWAQWVRGKVYELAEKQ